MYVPIFTVLSLLCLTRDNKLTLINNNQGSHWTLDMAANSDVFLRSLNDIYEAKLPAGGAPFDPKESHIQCFPHVINTCVQHTIKALNNGVDTDINDDEGTTSDNDDDKRSSVEGSNESDDSDEGSSDEKSNSERSNDGGATGGGGSGEDSEKDAPTSGVPGDPINKIRALVRGIRASGQRQEQFTNVILGGNQYGWWKDGQGQAMLIKQKQLLRDVRTRWDSTYQMLVRVREPRQVSLLLDIT